MVGKCNRGEPPCGARAAYRVVMSSALAVDPIQAAIRRARAVVFFDRRSLYQPGLRELAALLGVAMLVVEAEDPIDAKERLFQNIDHVRRARLSPSLLK